MNKNLVLFLAIFSKVVILFLLPSIISDLGYYYVQSVKILSGLIPYTQFKFEYPPLAILPIWLPGLFSKYFMELNESSYYKFYRFIFFTIDIGLLFYLKSRFENKPHFNRLILAITLISLPLAPLLYDRLDLLFGVILFGSMICVYDGKKMQGMSFAIFGIPFKLISLIFIPFFGLSFLSKRDFNLKSFLKWIGIPAALLLLGLLFYFRLDFLDFLKYHHNRGIQIESTWASIEFLMQKFNGGIIQPEYNYGAQHLKDVSTTLVFLANYTVIAMLGILFFMFIFLNINLNQMLLTSMVVFITFGKVLSPQFLIWFIPLIFFFVDSKKEVIIFGLISLLTGPVIFNYGAFINQAPWAWWSIALRNLLLLSWVGLRFQHLLSYRHQESPWREFFTLKGLPSQE